MRSETEKGGETERKRSTPHLRVVQRSGSGGHRPGPVGFLLADCGVVTIEQTTGVLHEAVEPAVDDNTMDNIEKLREKVGDGCGKMGSGTRPTTL